MNELTVRQLVTEFCLQMMMQMMYILPGAGLCFLTAGREKLLRSPKRLALECTGAVGLYGLIYYLLWLYLDVSNPIALIPFLALAFFYFRHVTEENGYILLFIFLCAILYTRFNVSLFLALSQWLFPKSAFDLAHDLWRPADIFVIVVTTVFTLPAVLGLMRKKVRPLLEKSRGGEVILLWLLPTGFILLLAVNVTQNLYVWVEESIVSFLVIMAVVSTLQSVAVMHQSRKSAQKEEALRQVDAQMKTQRERFAELLEYNRQVRVLRHDMRHHLLVLEGMLADGNYQKAEDYLREYGATVESAEKTPLCQNYVADVIARHYQVKAGELGIHTDFLLSLPQECGIADADLCVVLGNLLENAVNACSVVEEEPLIRLRVKAEGEEVLIAVDNTCGSGGTPGGTGLGIPSVKAVARAYGGMARINRNGDMFEASVLLTAKRMAEEEKRDAVE